MSGTGTVGLLRIGENEQLTETDRWRGCRLAAAQQSESSRSSALTLGRISAISSLKPRARLSAIITTGCSLGIIGPMRCRCADAVIVLEYGQPTLPQLSTQVGGRFPALARPVWPPGTLRRQSGCRRPSIKGCSLWRRRAATLTPPPLAPPAAARVMLAALRRAALAPAPPTAPALSPRRGDIARPAAQRFWSRPDRSIERAR
jgi:hypothetical protein